MKKSITLLFAISLVGITTLAVSSSNDVKLTPVSDKNIDKNVSTSPTDKNGYLEENDAKWD